MILWVRRNKLMGLSCIYYNRNGETCGNDKNCKGCKKNPNDDSILTYDEFMEGNCYWNCDGCKYCNPGAFLKNVESPCKRLDHKHYSFAKAIFYSYDCGQRNGCVCSDFEPRESCAWAYNHWNKEYINEYVSKIADTDTMYLCIDHNWEVRYAIKKVDFVNGTFLNPDRSLKWLRKEYYKQSRKELLGYIYCNEYPDGTIEYGANKPINWELIKE